MKRALHFISLLGLVLMSSCTKELQLPDIQSQSRITLIGEFIVGRPLQFRAGQSIAINTTNTLQFKILQDLNITARDNFQNQFYFKGSVDTLTNLLFTLPFSNDTKAFPGATYYLKATHPNLTSVEADIYVPPVFQCNLIDTQTIINANHQLLKCRIEIKDEANAQNFYAMECVKQVYKVSQYFFYENKWCNKKNYTQLYDSLTNAGVNLNTKSDTLPEQKFIRVPVYTEDANTDNLSMGNPLNVNKRILLPDANFNGSIYTTSLIIDKSFFVSNKEEEKGEIFILIKSIAPEYYKFLKAYEQYDAQQGLNSFNKPIKIDGNIRGGTGMIGGVALQEYRYLFDQW